MIRPHILTTALLALSIIPAAAADRPAHAPWVGPVTGPAVIYAAPPVVAVPVAVPHRYAVRRYARAPYFVVDQGPEFSGPNIAITEITWTETDVHRAYPYIGSPYPYIGASGPAISALASVRQVPHRRVASRTIYARPVHHRPNWTSPAMHRPTRVAVRHTIKVKPIHAKPSTTKSSVTKPSATKHSATRPVATTTPATTKPADIKPADSKPATIVSKPAGDNSAEKPAATPATTPAAKPAT